MVRARLFDLGDDSERLTSLDEEGGNTVELAGVLDFLRTQPQFRQIRQLVQTNPQLLEPLVAQLAQSNPELGELISQHQEEFLGLLSEPLGPEPQPGQEQTGAPAQGTNPASQYISVTPEERSAIERLEALGFPRQKVIEAYFACDKNEMLAANYLFDHGQEED